MVTYRECVQMLWICCLECLYNCRCIDWLSSYDINNVECDGALATVEWPYISNLCAWYMWVYLYG